jgi:hypothetical protein
VDKLPPEKVEGKIIRGVVRKEVRPEFCSEYAALCKRVQEKGGE